MALPQFAVLNKINDTRFDIGVVVKPGDPVADKIIGGLIFVQDAAGKGRIVQVGDVTVQGFTQSS